MEDYLKGNRKMMSHAEKHHKVSYEGKHHASAPYESGEMKKAMHCSQDGLGIGKGHPYQAKMPEYGVYGDVISVSHGHKDVRGGKI